MDLQSLLREIPSRHFTIATIAPIVTISPHNRPTEFYPNNQGKPHFSSS
jgi:hypothetical protein